MREHFSAVADVLGDVFIAAAATGERGKLVETPVTHIQRQILESVSFTAL